MIDFPTQTVFKNLSRTRRDFRYPVFPPLQLVPRTGRFCRSQKSFCNNRCSLFAASVYSLLLLLREEEEEGRPENYDCTRARDTTGADLNDRSATVNKTRAAPGAIIDGCKNRKSFFSFVSNSVLPLLCY